MRSTLELTGYSRTAHELAYEAAIAGRSFTTRFRYQSVDLLDLERRHGTQLLRRLYFHAIAFDFNRLVSLKPDAVDFGPMRDCVNESFVELWERILEGVWAQWRYENDLPDWAGPEIRGDRARTGPAPTPERAGTSPTSTVLFCGGGKDSLVSAKLLEGAGLPYDSFAYSHSLYGNAEHQHRLIDRLLEHCAPHWRHRLEIHDDFRPGEIELSNFGVRTVTAAETPSSLFLALPLALAHGFRNLVVGHERSADSGNLVWDATGEMINHQWGKSLEAETLLGDYVHRNLLPGVRYFSVLKGLRDPVIYHALRSSAEAVVATHSCNVAKPWCRRCPKCHYVFLGYAACLEPADVLRIFGRSLFEDEANLDGFAALLGRGGHLPFECVGQIEESRLFLELAARRGWDGVVVDRLRRPLDGDEVDRALRRLCGAHPHHRIPTDLTGELAPLLARQAAEAGSFVRSTLGSA